MKVITVLLSSFLLATSLFGAAPRPPNIVFIFADDWGWGDLSCHGNTWLQTPQLDRLASEGTDFQQFNVLNPVCSPSRTAVMTGRYPARFSIHQHFAAPTDNATRGMPDWLDSRAVMLPRLLQQAGYRTAHFGKWHLTNAQTHGAPRPVSYGYDAVAVFNGGADEPSADLHATAPNAVAFIQANQDRPFFLNVWLHESHTPHVPTAESMARWKHLDEQKQVYAAVITDGDNAVGQILDALKTASVEENTLVVFSADNGPESTGGPAMKGRAGRYDTWYSVGETGGLRGRKRSLFEGGVRVPFLVRWPGHTPAGKIDRTTVLTAVDLLPTFCAAAGVPLPAGYQGDGENVLAAFSGQPFSRSRPIFWEWQGKNAEPDWWPRLAVREGEWKLMLTADAQRVELHRLDADRAEAADVARQHPDIVARLSRMALAWKATLPAQPDPACISVADRAKKMATSGQPAKKATPDRSKAFTRLDTNHDGVISLEEYQAGQKGDNLEQRFKVFDRNGDGKLTREEFVNPGGK